MLKRVAGKQTLHLKVAKKITTKWKFMGEEAMALEEKENQKESL